MPRGGGGKPRGFPKKDIGKKVECSLSYLKLGIADRVVPGSFVLVEEDGTTQNYLISNNGQVQNADKNVCIASLGSPIAQALIGRGEGEKVKALLPGGNFLEMKILKVNIPKEEDMKEEA